MNRKTILITALAFVLAACSGENVGTLPPQTANPEAAEIDTSLRADTLVLTATVLPDDGRRQVVVAPTDGMVEGLRVVVGDDVRRSQVLATMRAGGASELMVRRQEAVSELRMAQSELATRQSLLADGMASALEVGQSEERVRVAETALAQFDAMLPRGSERTMLDITASISGTVLARHITDSRYVQAGEPLVEVAELSRVWVLGDVYESDISRVHCGDSVVVNTLAHPDECHRAVIDKVYSALDPVSKTMKVRVSLANPDRHLLPGMFATITLIPAQQ